MIDWDLRNDENRPSLTSGAVAEERQELSSKNTIGEVADAITGDDDIGLWPTGQPIYRKKCENVGWNMKQVLFDIVMKSHFWNMMFHNTEKTETCRGNVPQILFVARTTMVK